MKKNLSRALIIPENNMSIFPAPPISITIWVITAIALLGSSLRLAEWWSRPQAGGA